MQRNISMMLVVVLLILVGIMVGRDGIKAFAADGRDEAYKGERLLVDVADLIRKYYVTDVDNRKLYEHAVQGMLQGQDHFSAFIPAEEIDEFNKNVKGAFGGIGIVIGQQDGWLLVISPIEDGPAYKAGVLAGDRIVEIEGRSTEGLLLEDAVKKLTGQPGTKTTFTVLHEATLARETFTVTREVVHVKTVKGIGRDAEGHWKFIVDKERGIAYIRLTSFTNDSVEDLRKALDDAKAQGMKSLILDLRFNPGGVLEGAIGVADLFLDEGVIVSTRGRVDKPEEFVAHKGDTIDPVPMAVLINDRSASASEIVAGALQDHNRAIVVGERTYGKGSVQRIFPLEGNRSAIRMTVAKYYLPSGRCLHREDESKVWGVDPLIEVKMTPQEYADVFIARRDSEVLKTSGKKNGTETPAKDEGKSGADKSDTKVEPKDQSQSDKPAPAESDKPAGSDEKPKLISPEESILNGKDAEKGDKADKEKKKPSEDRQLLRAIDVLKMLPVVQKFDMTGVIKAVPVASQPGEPPASIAAPKAK